jgi:hypothetical protein
MNCPLCKNLMNNLAIFNMDICIKCELNFCINQSENDYQALMDVVKLAPEKVEDMKLNGYYYWRNNFYTTSEMTRITKLRAFI